MKIIIDNTNFDNNQRPLVTIDTDACTYPYAIRDAIKLALELDGYSLETINEVLGITQDVCCEEVKTFKSE